MSLSLLSNELLHDIASRIQDPCDLKSLLRTARRFHTAIAPIFTSRFSHLDSGSANILDFRRNDLQNWVEPGSKDVEFSDDPAVHSSRQRHLQNCNLAYHALSPGWDRLLKHLDVPGSATILLAPFSAPFDSYRKIPPQSQVSLLVGAVLRGNLPIVQYLVDERATPVDCWGVADPTSSRRAYAVTPLLAACMCRRADIAGFLLARGADPALCNLGGMNPVMMSVMYHAPEVLELVLKTGTRVVCFPPESEAPVLHDACRKPVDVRCVKLLVEYGHPLGIQDYDDTEMTVLLEGMTTYDNETKTLHGKDMTDGEREVLAYLLAKAEDVAVFDGGYGTTPLHVAAKYGLMEAIEMLLAAGAGANPATTSDTSRTPAATARNAGFEDAARVLENAAAGSSAGA